MLFAPWAPFYWTRFAVTFCRLARIGHIPVAAKSIKRGRTRAKAPVTPGLRPGYDLPATDKLANRRTNARLVAEVVGDRKGQISRNKVDGHVQNLKPAIPNRKRPHD